jgi:hypothetical protein
MGTKNGSHNGEPGMNLLCDYGIIKKQAPIITDGSLHFATAVAIKNSSI